MRNSKRKMIVILFFLLTSLPIHKAWGFDEWTKDDWIRQGLFVSLLTVDYLQTKEILDNPEYFELNPYVTKENVDIYFAGSLVANTIIPILLPKGWREKYQYGLIGIEVVCVANNFSIGVRIRWPF